MEPPSSKSGLNICEPTDSDPQINEPPMTTEEIEENVFMQAWNLVSSIRAKHSTEASIGSTANMYDALTESGELLDVVPEWKPPKTIARTKPVPPPRSRVFESSVKKNVSGMNCVLGGDDEQDPKKIPSNVQHHGELGGQDTRKYFDDVLDNGYPSVTNPFLKDISSEHPLSSVLNPLKAPLNTLKRNKKSVSSTAENDLKTTRARSDADVSSCIVSEDVQNQNGGRNNININLTIAMGQYQNVGQEAPTATAHYSTEELKPPSRRPGTKKPKMEASMQTDEEYEPPFGFNESESLFPSIAPSGHGYLGEHQAHESAVSIPETRVHRWNEFMDVDSVVAYAGGSVKSFAAEADDFIHNYIIMPEEQLYTDEELMEGEEKMGISLMRLAGVPQLLRHDIYNEALHNLQAVQDISLETFSIIADVIDCLCDSEGQGKEELLNRVRNIATITTDFELDSEDWRHFEAEFCIFAKAIAEVMKSGFQLGKDVVCTCKEKLINLTRPAAGSTMAILPAPSSEELIVRAIQYNINAADQDVASLGQPAAESCSVIISPHSSSPEKLDSMVHEAEKCATKEITNNEMLENALKILSSAQAEIKKFEVDEDANGNVETRELEMEVVKAAVPMANGSIVDDDSSLPGNEHKSLSSVITIDLASDAADSRIPDNDVPVIMSSKKMAPVITLDYAQPDSYSQGLGKERLGIASRVPKPSRIPVRAKCGSGTSITRSNSYLQLHQMKQQLVTNRQTPPIIRPLQLKRVTGPRAPIVFNLVPKQEGSYLRNRLRSRSLSQSTKRYVSQADKSNNNQ